MSANRQKTDKKAPKTAFKPGQSGNPSGRPKMPDNLREAIRAACPAAVELLVSIVTDTDVRAADRLKAAEILLERGYGKPAQSQDINLDVSGGLDVGAQIRAILLEDDNAKS